MQRQKIESKLLREIGYDPVSKVLEVMFHSGKVYRYFDVAPEHYEAMQREKSVGSYFLAKIKPGHEYRKVDADEAETQVE